MKRKTRRWLATAVAFALAFSLTGTEVLAVTEPVMTGTAESEQSTLADSTTQEVSLTEVTPEDAMAAQQQEEAAAQQQEEAAAQQQQQAAIQQLQQEAAAVEGVYLSEGFEDGQIPEGWTTDTNTENYEWSVGTCIETDETKIEAHSGEGIAFAPHLQYYAEQYAWLITPTLDLSNVTGDVVLSFWFVNPTDRGGFDELGIFYRLGEGDWQELCETTKYHDNWSKHAIVLPEESKAEAVQFGFRAENFNIRGIGLDDVLIQNAENEEKHVVTYVANYDGTEEVYTESHVDTASVFVVDNQFTAPEGMHFGGWNTEPDGTGLNCKQGNHFEINRDVTFYAQWLENLTSLDEAFDCDGIPVGWNVIRDDEDNWWHVVKEGDNSLFDEHVAAMDSFNSHNDGTAWLITPMLDLRNGSGNYVLGLSYCNPEYDGKYFGLNICYRIDGGEWQVLRKITDYNDYYTSTEMVLPEEARVNNVEIGFQAVEAYSYGVGIESVYLRAEQRYAVFISEDIAYGFVRSDKELAEPGTTITLNVRENGVSTFDKLIIKKGNEFIDFEQVDDETFTFVMPEGNVIVDASFIMPTDFAFYEGFDEEGSLDGWTLVDGDGDGYGWEIRTGEKMTDSQGNPVFLSAPHTLASASWYKYNVLYPDNWAITPAIEVPANAVLTFNIKGCDPNYAGEIMAVYVGTSTNLDDMVKVGDDYVGSPAFTKYEVNLGEYAGETIYVGFRHYNISDMFILLLDDVMVRGEKTSNLELTFKHNIEFDNNIAMHYIIPKTELDGYSNLKLVIDKEVYAEGVATPTIQQYVLENPTSYEVKGVDYWHFTFPGISASEMGNALSAKVVCEKEGLTYESQADVYTVKDYAYGRLEKTSSASYKKVLVDMLNYGAAAQEHFKKNAGKPVNADLTDEQKAFGSSLEGFSVKSAEKVIALEGGATAAFDAKNLVFGSNVELVYRMDFSNFKTDAPAGTTEEEKMANVKVVFTYDNGKGEKTVTVPYSQFTMNKGKYVASCSVLTPAEMGCTVNATIYDGDVAVSDTLQYSIETYVYNRLSGTGSSSETFKELLKRMVLYGRAVNEHF